MVWIFSINVSLQTRKVSFDSDGTKLKGILFLPDSYKTGQKLPGVVVTGLGRGEEQMPQTYAIGQSVCRSAFDFSGWGESGERIGILKTPIRARTLSIQWASLLRDPGSIPAIFME